MKNKKLFWITVIFSILILSVLFYALKHVTPEQIAKFNGSIPLPVFTILVGFVDSFNPCNLFAFILLLGVLIQASQSKLKIYLIGTIFITVVYAFYFLVMAAWLNIFKFIGLVDPLRIFVGILAIIAGIINCKELFFFHKGISLMIPQKQKEILYAKMRKIKEIIENGSIPLLVVTTIALAVFTSFIELLCTSGFPVIYTSVLATKHAASSLYYYYYLALYNLIYIIPLLVIIFAAGFFIRSKQLSKEQAGIIEFISGLIMIILGLILLFRPQVIM